MSRSQSWEEDGRGLGEFKTYETIFQLRQQVPETIFFQTRTGEISFLPYRRGVKG